MRTLLEKAIVHLLNGEDETAQKLFREFMIARARQIHESLRTGDDAILNEDWDSEITSEAYFSEDDLKSAEDEIGDEVGADTPDVGAENMDDAMDGGEMPAGDDMGGDVPAGDDTMDAPMGDDMGGEGSTEDRLADMEDQLADIQAEFDKIMAALDIDDESEAADTADAGEAPEGDEFGGDDAGEPEGDAAENADDAAEAGDLEDDMGDEAEGDEPKDEKVAEDMDFEDIAESILADLDRVNVEMTDGKEVGVGKTIAKNDKSPSLQKGVGDRKGAAPVQMKSDNHPGFEREPAPPVKTMKPRRNNVPSTDGAMKPASTNVGGAELSKKMPEANTKSPVNANAGQRGN